MQSRLNNAPSPIDSFVGRERELNQIREWFDQQASRLLTLVGPGGVGKTRLTLETLRAPGFDGAAIIYIDLTRLHDSALFADHLCDALSLPPAPSNDALMAAIEALRLRNAVLALDNFEHVRDAAPELVELLIKCPSARAIVTSRLPLRVLGEQVLRISPLPVSESSERSDSTELFIRRAKAANMDWEPPSMDEISRLCRRLDGLPLAIEIAAARVRNVTVDRILADLDTQRNLLQSTHVGGTGRIQSLNGAMDWSISLLNPEERRAFARLSVFRGRFGLDDAKDVVGNSDVEEMLIQFGEQSLVLIEQHRPEAPFRLLETIRLYAKSVALRENEWASASLTHAERFLAKTKGLSSLLEGPNAAAALAEFVACIDNIRAAMDWFAEIRDSKRIAEFGIAMAPYWQLRGPFSEAAGRLGDAVDAARSLNDSRKLTELLLENGIMLAMYGDNARAKTVFEEARVIFCDLRDRSGEARALNLLGTAADVLGDLDHAEQSLRASLAIREQLGDELRVAATQNNLALVLRRKGRPDMAEELLGRALSYYERSGHEHRVAVALSNLAEIALDSNRLDQAEAYLRRSGEIHLASGDLRGTATSKAGLGDVALERGEITAASEFYRAGAADFESVGDMRMLGEIRKKLEGIQSHQGSESPQQSLGNQVLPNPTFAVVSGVDRLNGAEPMLCVWLLGAFRMEAADPAISFPAWARRAHRQLFQYLCLTGGRPVSRAAITEQFWPHLDLEAGQHALRKALSDIRSVLAPLGSLERVLTTSRDSIEVHSGDGIWIDAVEYRSMTARAQALQVAGDTSASEKLIEEAVDLNKGEICAGETGSDWLDEERQRFADIQTAALLTLARAARRAEEWEKTAAFAGEALDSDPCLEPACRLRMVALTNLGRRADALRAFESCRNALRSELATEPSKRTLALVDQIRTAGTPPAIVTVVPAGG